MLSIVIVNWNSGCLLRECLESIDEVDDSAALRVVVVDNGSSDDSISQVGSQSKYKFELVLICNPDNFGFAKACNQGAAAASSEFLLFLNPDTRVYPGAFSVPIDYLKRSESSRVGIVGIQLRDERECISHSCSRFPALRFFLAQALGICRFKRFKHLSQAMNDWDHGETREVDQVMGAFFLMRRDLFEELGGFDERFFVYFEEVDLSFRAKQKGWKTIFLADVHAFHAAGGTSRQVKAHRLFYSLRSRLLYGFKHFSRFDAALLLLLTLCVEPVSRCLLALFRGEMDSVRNTIRGYGMLCKDLPKLLFLGQGR